MKLREYRRRRGLTLSELAESIGVTEGAASRYETGTRRPRPGIIARIHRTTRGLVTANDFFEPTRISPTAPVTTGIGAAPSGVAPSHLETVAGAVKARAPTDAQNKSGSTQGRRRDDEL